MPWHLHERGRRRLERERELHGDNAEQRMVRLYAITPEGVPLYVEVDDPDPLLGPSPLDDEEEP
jgi:hypothetical protein